MNTPKVTVLMYHALVQTQSAAHGVHITADLFEQHIAWLHAHGYEAITVTELYARLITNQLAPNTIVITFDDGYWSLLRWATPILTRYNFTATLFLTTGFVGLPDFSTAPAAFAQAVPPHDRPLSWAEIQTLQQAGWDIQAHSCTHRPHTTLTASELRMELELSRRLISSHFPRCPYPLFYAFPYGNYNRHVLRALEAAGYVAGFSVHSGQASTHNDLRRLPRIEINTTCTLSVFEHLVRTGYTSDAKRNSAKLRDVLFKYPVLKDILQKLVPKLVN